MNPRERMPEHGWLPPFQRAGSTVWTEDTISTVEFTSGRGDAGLVRLDPLRIASIYPGHNEDRILVKLDEVPADLIKAGNPV